MVGGALPRGWPGGGRLRWRRLSRARGRDAADQFRRFARRVRLPLRRRRRRRPQALHGGPGGPWREHGARLLEEPGERRLRRRRLLGPGRRGAGCGAGPCLLGRSRGALEGALDVHRGEHLAEHREARGRRRRWRRRRRSVGRDPRRDRPLPRRPRGPRPEPLAPHTGGGHLPGDGCRRRRRRRRLRRPRPGPRLREQG